MCILIWSSHTADLDYVFKQKHKGVPLTLYSHTVYGGEASAIAKSDNSACK